LSSVSDTLFFPHWRTNNSGIIGRETALTFGCGFLIVALSFLAYLPILPGAFLMDDQRLIHIENPLVTGQLQPITIWFQCDFPLSNLVLYWEWLAWGDKPMGYNIVGISLHALSGILLWRLFARMKLPAAWMAGALFALHPVCVNSVARIAEIKNTLSLPFFLISALCYLSYERAVLYPGPQLSRNAQRSGTLAYATSLIAFLLALFTKTSTVMLPIVLLACAVWQRGRLSPRDLAHVAPHFVLAIAFGLMSVWFQQHQALAGDLVPGTTLWERILGAPRVFWFYLGKALLPLSLNLVYPRWTIDVHSLSDFLPLVACCAAFGLCWCFRRTWGRNAMFVLSSFAILLFPTLGLFDAQFLAKWQVSDHLQYLPLIAPVTLVAMVLACARSAALFRIGSTLLILGAFLLANQRVRVFASEESLMQDTLAKNPAAADAHNDLGVILAQRNQFEAAVAHFSTATRLAPNNAAAQCNLGQALASQGKLSQAEFHLSEAVRLKPHDADVHFKLANVLIAQGTERKAALHLRRSLRSKPLAETRLQLAALLYRTGDFSGAATEFRQVVETNPDSHEALNNLAWLLATCADGRVRDGAFAVRCAERACQITDFKHSVYLSTLAAAYAETGRFEEAVTIAEKAMAQQLAEGDTRMAEVNQQLLTRCYRAGKPHRERPSRLSSARL
jgi:Flp pilus assembly protein TadD